MNRFLAVGCVAVLALLAGTAAQAQTFQGFYIGGVGGVAHGSSDVFTGTVFVPIVGYFSNLSIPDIATAGTQKPTSTGFTGGFTSGYNWQSGHVVAGFEVDFGSMHLNGSKSSTVTYTCCPMANLTVLQTVKTDWLFTARPRLGLASGHWLVYGTGGFAATNRNYQALFTDTFATAHENGGISGSTDGWIAGGGVEAQFGNGGHWSIKGEFLHADFSSATTTSTNLTAFGPPPLSFPSNIFTHSTDLTTNMGRVGLNFRF